DMVLDVGFSVTTGFTEDDGSGTRVDVGSHEPPVPWRNTAIGAAQLYCGYTPHIVDVRGDAVGKPRTIIRSDTLGGSNPGDTAGYAYYDADQQALWYTVSASGTLSSPFGIVRIA